jgi:hypothetical protein
LLAVGYWATGNSGFDVGLSGAQLTAPEKDSLPAKIGSWEKSEFAKQTREANSFFGEHSSVWLFTRSRHTAVVALDYPFPSWHDLTWCYTGRGWQIEKQDLRTDLGVPGGFVEVRMTQPTCRHGFLVFCEFNGSGQPLTAHPGGIESSLFRHQATFDRLKSRFGFERETYADPSGPINQLQVFWEGYDKLPNEDEAALVELFVHCGKVFRESLAPK